MTLAFPDPPSCHREVVSKMLAVVLNGIHLNFPGEGNGLIFGSRLHDAPYMGDMEEDSHNRWDSQLLVVPGVVHFDSSVGLASSPCTLLGGLS